MKVIISESQLRFLIEGKTKSTTEEFIEKSQKIQQNPDGTPKYNYDKVNYVNNKTPVIITCPKHGDFNQIPNNHLLGKGCPKCGLDTRKLTTKEFIEKSQKIHQNPDGTPKYNYDKVNYVHSIIPVTITCPKHGDFNQIPNSHLLGKGCPKCGGTQKSATQEFIEKSQKIHQNPDGTPKYNYDKVNYVHSRTPVTITCPKHGDFDTQSPKGHLQGQGCPRCRESKGEKEIYNYIIQEYGYEVIPQKIFDDCTNEYKGKKRCYKYEFDFYLPQFNTIIEFDGKQHFYKTDHFHKTDEGFQERVEDDIYKVNYCKNKYKLIRISYNEKDIIGQLNKGLKSNKKLWLSDNYPKLGWNK
jgi:Zn finger protein HypA/HybF involved in hydrogenase expression/very-short-patch-repair endonuclease